MQIEIVPLQEKHMLSLSEMEKVIFTQPWSLKSFQELLTREYCHYLVAECDGMVAGIAGMVVLAGEGDIDKVMVAEGMRGQGIADRLLKELFRVGEAIGVTAYTLEVRVGNEPAIKLYEKNGFCREGIRPKFYEQPVEDALIMWKR